MRPISLLSCPSKILERIGLNRLKWQTGDLHPSLFAYQQQRSTSTCLMSLLGLLHSRSGLVVFLDLEKAFELASPPAILEALINKVIRGHILQWVSNFLTDRSARVRFQGHLPPPHSHTLGTLQGSCLSPFLFNILMEGLFTTNYGPGVQLLCYADDLALFFPKRQYKDLVPRALHILQERTLCLPWA